MLPAFPLIMLTNFYDIRGVFLYFYFFGGLECVGHSFASVAHFVILIDERIRTQRAAVTSRRATNLATHLSHLATHLPHLSSHLPF
jgi:hypothetical protein